MEIKVRADDARQHADLVKSRAAESDADFEALRQRLAPLADAFQGRAADAFQARLDEWQGASKSLLDALDGLGQFLTGAANAIEQTDVELANQIQG